MGHIVQFGSLMSDLAQILPLAGDETENTEIRFSYSRAEQPWANRTAIRLIERLSGQPRLEKLYRGWASKPHPHENLFSAAVRLLKLKIETDGAAWAQVPPKGPVLFIANHPFGVIDGLMMGHLATRVRPDVKIMTHSLLAQAPEARDFMLPVDFGGTPEAQMISLQTRRRTLDWLATGHAVVVFPAGGVSTAQNPFTGPALESPWHPFVAKLARIHNVTIVPVYFHGQNSRAFHVLSHIHYALRIALLFRETVRRIGSTIRVEVGEPIRQQDLPQGHDRNEIMRFLRLKTLGLNASADYDLLQEFKFPAHVNAD
jgi:putative hemolysin